MKHSHAMFFIVLVMVCQISNAKETEPNNTVSQANILSLNESNSGKISPAGDVDYWKVTTTADGKLKIKLTTTSGKSIGVYLYDKDGATYLDSANADTTFSQSKDGLAAGTYYIKVMCLSAADTASYSISNTLTPVSQTNDAEPDDSRSQALALTLNAASEGHVGYYHNNKRDTADWYKVTTTGDGLLKLNLTSANGTSIYLALYDNNGTTILDSSHSGIAFSLSKDGLATGIYYIKIKCVTDSGFAPYTLADSLATPAQAIDAEPNDSKTLALPISSNSTKTGHVGYYYTNRRDTADWYKITTTSDKKLKLNLKPANGHSLSMFLYANNGTSLIGSSSSAGAFSLTTDGLKADVYYAKIKASKSSDFAPYTFADSTFTSTNDSSLLPLNFRYKTKISTPGGTKWWRLTTNADGKLNLTLAPLSGKYLYLYLYDHDRTTVLNSSYSNSVFTETTDGLAPGTYYLKIVPYYSTDTASYTIADTLVTPIQATETEPNNSKSKAITLSLNSTKTGHIGYYYNNKRDTSDWYKLTTNADGSLNLSLTPANGSYIYVSLYDNNGTLLLNQNYSNAAFNVSTDGLAAGTYYIRIFCYYTYGFTPYTLTNSLVKPAVANDAEPDDSKTQAVLFNENSTKTGHSGYYYNNKRDSADWYKLTTSSDGLMQLKLTPANGSYIYVNLYDNDGTTLLNSSYSNVAFVQSTDGLAAGTYYLKVFCYYNNGFTPYTLTNNLITPAEVNDAEPNDSKAQAVSLNVNSTKTGHTGYYYNNKRDSADWYKVTTTSDGLIKLNLTPSNGSYIYVNLYDNDGTTLLNSSYSNVAFVQNTDGLAAGTYYLKVFCYYNNGFTPYTLTDSLATYSYAGDPEPNKHPYQGKSVAANSTATGHVNFYHNLVRDSLDWWKLNYTGSGNLQFTFKLAPKKIDGSIPYTYFIVYKDTLAAPIYSNYFNTPTNVINLSSLTKTNYYIKIITYYSSDFVTYSFANSFTSTNGVILANTSQKPAPENKFDTDPDNVSIYPNPAVNRFHIQINGNHTTITSFTLRDAGGKLVLSRLNLPFLSHGSGMDINISNLPAGVYFLNMIDVNKINTVKQIVITK